MGGEGVVLFVFTICLLTVLWKVLVAWRHRPGNIPDFISWVLVAVARTVERFAVWCTRVALMVNHGAIGYIEAPVVRSEFYSKYSLTKPEPEEKKPELVQIEPVASGASGWISNLKE